MSGETRIPDFKALEALFKRFYKPLRAYAYRFVADEYQAEDIVQDVFLDIWQRHESIHGCPNKKLTVHIDIHTTKKKYQNVRILIHQKVMAIQRTVVYLPWDSHSVQGFPKVIAFLIGIRSRYSIIHRGSHGTGILH